MTKFTSNLDNGVGKKKFEMPDAYVVLFAVVVLATIATWVIPAGEFERTVDVATGRNMVIPGSYHRVDQTPVSLFGMFTAIHAGFIESGYLIFFVCFSAAYISTLFKSGTLHGAIKTLLEKVEGKEYLMIPVFMIFFGFIGTTSGSVEATYALIPIFVGIGIAMGYDAIVGLAMIELGAFTGFASSTVNPFTIGLAQTISGLPLFSGLWYRIIIFVVMMSSSIWWVIRYAKYVKKNPELSLVKDLNFGNVAVPKDKLLEMEFTTRQKLLLLGFLITVGIMVFGALKLGWYISELASLFLIMTIVSGIIAGWGPNRIASNFIQASGEVAYGAFIIGLARAITVVLNQGNIIDTIINSLSLPLTKLPAWFSAQGMLFVQHLINFFIPSGSGQAAVSMPIMAPLADLVGVNRQIATLAFQFGDGFSNLIWPTCMVLIFCGIAKIPMDRWYRFFLPLAGIHLLLQMAFIAIAMAINLGPF